MCCMLNVTAELFTSQLSHFYTNLSLRGCRFVCFVHNRHHPLSASSLRSIPQPAASREIFHSEPHGRHCGFFGPPFNMHPCIARTRVRISNIYIILPRLQHAPTRVCLHYGGTQRQTPQRSDDAITRHQNAGNVGARASR